MFNRTMIKPGCSLLQLGQHRLHEEAAQGAAGSASR
jgi:hypothetical protein